MRNLLLILLMLSSGAYAKCTAHDAWHGEDKALHFVGVAAVSGYVGAATERPEYGLAWGVGIAAAKEALDATGSGDCTLQDFAVGVAGALAGYAGAKWVLIPRAHGATVAYSRSF